MVWNIILEFFYNNKSLFFGLFTYTSIIFIYSIFIWKFYIFLAKRDIVKLNLGQYNNSSHPLIKKVLAVAFYSIEYLIILPFLVFFWFVVFSSFLLVLSESNNIENILLISAAIISAIRLTAYVSENLSRDLSKILPFTLLAVFIINLDFFNVEKIWGKILQLPGIFEKIIFFLAFIFLIEFILRGFYTFIELVYSYI